MKIFTGENVSVAILLALLLALFGGVFIKGDIYKETERCTTFDLRLMQIRACVAERKW